MILQILNVAVCLPHCFQVLMHNCKSHCAPAFPGPRTTVRNRASTIQYWQSTPKQPANAYRIVTSFFGLLAMLQSCATSVIFHRSSCHESSLETIHPSYSPVVTSFDKVIAAKNQARNLDPEFWMDSHSSLQFYVSWKENILYVLIKVISPSHWQKVQLHMIAMVKKWKQTVVQRNPSRMCTLVTCGGKKPYSGQHIITFMKRLDSYPPY